VARVSPDAATDAGRRTYYLALGDSLSTGVQPIGDEASQFRTGEGYADQLDAIARLQLPELRTVKLGYPGESTVTMINGGLTEYPHGSQLDEAVAFLAEHRETVEFVTLDIGPNDFLAYEEDALPEGMASIARNLPAILGRLREAAGERATIVGMNMYDPLLANWLLGPQGRDLARRSVWDGVVPINELFSSLYSSAGLLLADVETAFSTRDFATAVELDQVGEVPINVARVCEWTWAIAPPPLGPDFHANARGYRVIAETFAARLQLRR
jgi:lysophospholipase L1-like esterase